MTTKVILISEKMKENKHTGLFNFLSNGHKSLKKIIIQKECFLYFANRKNFSKEESQPFVMSVKVKFEGKIIAHTSLHMNLSKH